MTDAEYSSWVSTAYLTPTHADRRLTSSGSTHNVAAEARFYGQNTIVGKLVYDKPAVADLMQQIKYRHWRGTRSLTIFVLQLHRKNNK